MMLMRLMHLMHAERIVRLLRAKVLANQGQVCDAEMRAGW